MGTWSINVLIGIVNDDVRCVVSSMRSECDGKMTKRRTVYPALVLSLERFPQSIHGTNCCPSHTNIPHVDCVCFLVTFSSSCFPEKNSCSGIYLSHAPRIKRNMLDHMTIGDVHFTAFFWNSLKTHISPVQLYKLLPQKLIFVRTHNGKTVNVKLTSCCRRYYRATKAQIHQTHHNHPHTHTHTSSLNGPSCD